MEGVEGGGRFEKTVHRQINLHNPPSLDQEGTLKELKNLLFQ